MSKLTKEQKDKIKQFVVLTETGEATAQNCLSQFNWRLEHAMDGYFSNPQRFAVAEAKPSVDRKKIDQLYQKYKDRSEDRILYEGVVRLLEDLKLDAVDIKVLIFAWKCQAKNQCEFSREEFQRGLEKLGADSLERINQKLQVAENELSNNTKLRDLYLFSYTYAQANPNQKNLELDVAIAYWRILLSARFRDLERWIEFIEKESKVKSIPRDTWTLLFDFVTTVNDNYDKYDKDGAWPVLIDEFVEFARPKEVANAGGGDDSMEY